jgi:hypothetical protein
LCFYAAIEKPIHVDLKIIFTANPIKTKSRHFFTAKIRSTKVHNAAMMNFVQTPLVADPFPSVFIRGQTGLKKMFFPNEPNLT